MTTFRDVGGLVDPAVVAWSGPDCDVVLANFAEAYGGGMASSALWQKASLLSARPGYLLIAPGEPFAPAGEAPAQTCVPWSRPGEALSWALLADPQAWEVLETCGRESERPLRLWAQVHSEGVAEIVRRLERRRIAVETEYLPAVSGGTVAYWNTKSGARTVLAEVPELAPHLPAATLCDTLAEVIAIVAGPARPGLRGQAGPGFGRKWDRVL